MPDKWKHAAGYLLSLAFLTQHNAFESHTALRASVVHLSVWPSTPLCGHVRVRSSTHPSKTLGCSQCGTTISRAAIHIREQDLVGTWVFISLEERVKSGIAGSDCKWCLTLGEVAKLFQNDCRFTYPPVMHESSSSSTSSPTLCIFCPVIF